MVSVNDSYLKALFSTNETQRREAADYLRSFIREQPSPQELQALTNSLILIITRAQTPETRAPAESLLSDPELRLSPYLEVTARDPSREPELREIALRMLVPHAATGVDVSEVARLAIQDEALPIALQGMALARALQQQGWPLLRLGLAHRNAAVRRAAAQAAYEQDLTAEGWDIPLVGDPDARVGVVSSIFDEKLSIEVRLAAVDLAANWPDLTLAEQKVVGQGMSSTSPAPPAIVSEAVQYKLLPKVPDTSPARQHIDTMPMRTQPMRHQPTSPASESADTGAGADEAAAAAEAEAERPTYKMASEDSPPAEPEPTSPYAVSPQTEAFTGQTTSAPEGAPEGVPLEQEQATNTQAPFIKGGKTPRDTGPAVVFVTQPPAPQEHYYACHIEIFPSTTDGNNVVDKICLKTHGLEQNEQPEAPFTLDKSYLLEKQLEGNIAYGTALFNTLFAAPELQQTYHLLISTADAHNAPVHIRLEISPQLAGRGYQLVQWEYVYDPDPRHNVRFWAGNPNTPFSRLLPFAKDPPPVEQVETLRVLFVVAGPANLGDPNGKESYHRLPQLNLTHELAIIENTLATLQTQLAAHNLQFGSQILISDKAPVTLTAIHLALAQAQAAGKPFHIVHLVAHGILRGGVHQIILENEQRQATPYDEETFAREFETEYGVRLVVLISCLSGRQNNADAYRGLAAQLVRQNIPAVIAMMQKVTIETGYAFTQLFYSNLAYHGVVDRALNAARRALYAGDDWDFMADAREWAVPLLFLRLADGRLFNTGQPAHTLQAPEFSPARWQAPPPTAQPDLQKMVNALVTEMGDKLAQNLSLSFAQQRTLEQRLLEVANTPPPAAATARPTLFSAEAAKREKLIALTQAYRRQPHRWPMLQVRRQARRQYLKQLQDPAWFIPANWQTFTTIAQVTVEGQTWETVKVPPAPPPFNAREIRQRIRRSPASLQIQGNLSWVLPAAPDLPDPAWVRELLQGPGTVLEKWKAYEQNPVQPPLLVSGLLHLAAPDEALPYSPELAQAIQQALNLQETLDYAAYLRLARDLFADAALGLTKLDDVFYFLQHLAAQALAPVPAATALEVDTLDSRLELPEETFPSLTAALNAAKHVILIGPPGTGKTTLAEDVARHAWDSGLSAGFVSVTATADWTTFDTIGGYMPDANGQLRFKPGVFLRAIRDNHWLIIDEINRADIDKAFGELFTVLSGQGVTLPYEQGGQPIRILPAGQGLPGGQSAQVENDYVLPKAWRIIGTMNVYDKASLFTMSNAFMRRFAFVDVDIPPKELYDYLIQSFMRQYPALDGYELHLPMRVQTLFDASDEELWPLMHHRALGPAIAQDIVRYLAERRSALERHRKLDTLDERDYRALAEAFNLYAAPQLDGVEEQVIQLLYKTLKNRFGQNTETLKLLQDRIKGLFPHIRRWGV